MSHYARVINDIVTEVIVIEKETLDEFLLTGVLSGTWIQTSYNTRGGIHYAPSILPLSAVPDDGIPLRKNYAQIGFTYDPVRDAFIPPKPKECPSFILNEHTCLWEPPIPKPQDGHDYIWREEDLTWIPFKRPKRITLLSATNNTITQ